MTTKKTKSSGKTSADKRSLNRGRSKSGGDPFNEQDPKRRLGNFNSAGEHSRIGGRTSGIVGQTTKKSRTDKRSAKKT